MNRSEARCEAFKLAFQITAHKDSYPQVVELFEEENRALKKSDKKQFVYIVSKNQKLTKVFAMCR